MVVVGWQEGRSVHLGYESPWRQCCSSCWHVWEGRRTVIRGGGMWQGCNWEWDEKVNFPGWLVQPGPWLSPRLAPGSSLTRHWTGPKRVDSFWLVRICFWLVGICWTYSDWSGFVEVILIGWDLLNFFLLVGICWTYSDWSGFVKLVLIVCSLLNFFWLVAIC